MLSNNDLLAVLWIIGSLGTILLTPGRIGKNSYSRLMIFIFISSSLGSIWFHETVIDVYQTSPVHGAILAFAQVGILTLTSKLWLTLNFHRLSKATQGLLYFTFYGAFLMYTICTYWLYKQLPELQLILYPLSSLAISLTAEALESRWK